MLTMGVGAYGWAWFRKELPDRTDAEIRGRMRYLYGSAELTRGVHALYRVAQDTGYSYTQLRRAQRALGQKWRRTQARGTYLISEEQIEELTGWLVLDYWSKRRELYGCVWCGTREMPHCSSGLCRPCYGRAVNKSRALGLPTTVSGKLSLAQDLVDRGGLMLEGAAMLERCLAKLRKGVTPQVHDLEALARMMEELLWS